MRSSPPGVLTIRSSDPEHFIATYNPLILVCFQREAAIAELEFLDELAARGLADGVIGGVLFVAARKDMRGGIEAKRRAIFERLVRRHTENSASAVVIQVEGFGGALMRSFLAGLLQLMPNRKRVQVCASVDEACRWLAPRHGLDAGALARAYAEASAHLGAARAS